MQLLRLDHDAQWELLPLYELREHEWMLVKLVDDGGAIGCTSRLLAGSRRLKWLRPAQPFVNESGCGKLTEKAAGENYRASQTWSLRMVRLCQAEVHWY